MCDFVLAAVGARGPAPVSPPVMPPPPVCRRYSARGAAAACCNSWPSIPPVCSPHCSRACAASGVRLGVPPCASSAHRIRRLAAARMLRASCGGSRCASGQAAPGTHSATHLHVAKHDRGGQLLCHSLHIIKRQRVHSRVLRCSRRASARFWRGTHTPGITRVRTTCHAECEPPQQVVLPNELQRIAHHCPRLCAGHLHEQHHKVQAGPEAAVRQARLAGQATGSEEGG